MRFRSGEQGQALVVIALALVVLIAALSFGIDWGYAMAQRRVMQNAADAAALGAGKFVATSVVELNGAPAFSVTQQAIQLGFIPRMRITHTSSVARGPVRPIHPAPGSNMTQEPRRPLSSGADSPAELGRTGGPGPAHPT